MNIPVNRAGPGKFHRGENLRMDAFDDVDGPPQQGYIEASSVRKAAWADNVTLSRAASASPALSGSL